MKKNEARMFFRLLALLIGIFGWGTFFLFVWLSATRGGWDWRIAMTALALAISMSYVALRGYMPKSLLRIYSWGPVGRDNELK